MNTSPLRNPRLRRFAVPVGVTLVVLIAALIFRGALVGWFTGQSMSAPSGVGVSEQAGPFQIQARIDPDPPAQKGNSLWLTVRGPGGEPVSGAKVKVSYRMPPMGGMSEMRGDADVSEPEEGTYRAQFDLPMAGGWTLTAEIAKGEQRGTATYGLTVGTAGLVAQGGSGDASARTSGSAAAAGQGALPAPFVQKVQAAQDVYEQLRGALAADRLKEAKSAASVLGKALGEAQAEAKGLPPGFAAALVAEQKNSAEITNASSLEAARSAFARLSQMMIELAAHSPELQANWHVFQCPMAEGKPRWMQRASAPNNPYLGSKMESCGTALSFSAADPHPGGKGDVAYYTCSMHPSVHSSTPGKCPICGMDLIPVSKASIDSGAVQVTPSQRDRLGLQTQPVQRKPLEIVTRALGQVKVDETRQVDVTLLVKGWVRDLRIAATGQPVRKGEVMFTLYSPEVYAAEQELLLAQKTRTAGVGAELVRAAKEKLRLWGVSNAQIASILQRGKAIENVPFLAPASGYVLEKNVVEGAEVQPGQKLFRIAPLDRVWIDAQVYEGDLPHVHVGEPAQVTLPYQPGKTYEGKVTYVYPTLAPASRTGTVRIELKNPSLSLKPQMYADVVLKRDEGERLQVPAEAVLYTGPRRIVFVDQGGTLVPKDVTLGVRAGDDYEVLEGLSAGDRVVTQGQFLIAAESRLKSATGFWAEGNR